jgi:hypothetical protein
MLKLLFVVLVLFNSLQLISGHIRAVSLVLLPHFTLKPPATAELTFNQYYPPIKVHRLDVELYHGKLVPPNKHWVNQSI